MTDSQFPLFDTPEPAAETPVYQRHSPTSQAAAEAIAPTTGTLRAEVYAFLKLRGEQGATDEEIQRALHMEGNTARPRRRELEQSGLIRDSGATRQAISGRSAVVWEVIPVVGNQGGSEADSCKD